MPITEPSIKTDPRRRRFFPYRLQRFRGLRGGSTGDVTLVAKSRKLLEVQIGDDWVQFDRHDAIALMCAIHAFLAFDEQFHDRILKLEMEPEDRAKLEELIAAYKRSDDARADARARHDEAEEAADGTVSTVLEDTSPARRPRRGGRHN